MSLVSRKLIQAAAGAGDTVDDDFANVVLLLDGDGTSGDDNNTFTDSSTNGYTITENGSLVQGSFSPYGDNWSVFFDGSNDAIQYSGNTNEFAFGTGDFNIEAWVNFSSISSTRHILSTYDGNQGGFSFYYDGTNNELRFRNGDVGITGETFNPETGVWYHVAVSRESSTLRFFVNGTQLGSDTTNYTQNIQNVNTYGMQVGRYKLDAVVAEGGYFSGYISNARIIKGSALYTSGFTPSTSPLTAVTGTEFLGCQSNRFVDNSGNSFTQALNSTPKVTPFSPFKNDDARDITTDGGSTYFSGINGDLQNQLDLGAARIPATGDFTFETWVYAEPKTGSNHALITQYLNSQSGRFRFFIGSSDHGTAPNRLIIFIPFLSLYGSAVVADNSWHHVVLEREGNVWRMYVDGVLDNSATASGSVYTGRNTRIGNSINTSGAHQPLQGYLSDCRLTTSAVYGGSSYTVPSTPVSAITNTSILLNFQDAGIYDRSGINNLDTVGNAQIDTAVKKYGTGSLEFDGSGDYLTAKVTSAVDFGSGDWTVECWINLSTINQFNNIVNFGRDTVSGISLDLNSSNQLRIIAMIGGSWTVVATGTTGLSADTWYHVAFVRNGSSFKIYLDGTEDGSGTNSGSITNPTSDASSAFQVGYWRILAGTDRYFSGYIDDLRITKGVARYTANFTPPTDALPKF